MSRQNQGNEQGWGRHQRTEKAPPGPGSPKRQGGLRVATPRARGEAGKTQSASITERKATERQAGPIRRAARNAWRRRSKASIKNGSTSQADRSGGDVRQVKSSQTGAPRGGKLERANRSADTLGMSPEDEGLRPGGERNVQI